MVFFSAWPISTWSALWWIGALEQKTGVSSIDLILDIESSLLAYKLLRFTNALVI